MTRFSHVVWFGLAFSGLCACGAAPTPTPAAAPAKATNPVAPHDNLNHLVDRYWDERVPPGHPLSPQFMADTLARERRFLAEVLAIPRVSLGADSSLTYEIFRRQRELDIEALTYPAELLPLNPFDGMPQQFARAAADMRQTPPKAVKDYENWQLQIDEYVQWTGQAIANMRDGVRRGYTSPRPLMARMLPLLDGYGSDTPANIFYLPIRAMPDSIKEPERTRLISSLTGAVRDKLLPAYRELHDFIQNEYLPRARRSVALSALPLGPSWYASRVRRATGTQLTPNEIHSMGVAEVDRLRARLLSMPVAAPPGAREIRAGLNARAGADPLARADASGSASAGGEELLSAYRELKTQTLAAMPSLFSAMPQADFEIRAWDPSRGPAAVLAYQHAASDGRTPAILYVNTAPSAAWSANVETGRFLQEAMPGRHHQSALQQERADLPKFRRFGSEPAFVDGWALYAASLGEELGVYRDDEARKGELLGQLKCAAALVVDTGLHAKNWTRAQAADYLRAQLADADADLMTDRFVALPGDALACKIGELKIQALRKRALEVLGTRFDLREFHSEILKDGAMPLDILEEKMQRWMAARR